MGRFRCAGCCEARVLLRTPGLAAGAAVFGFSSGIATGTGVIQVSLLLSAGLAGPAVLATDALSTIVLDLCKAALFQRFDLLDAEAAATGAVIGFATLPGSALAAWLSTRIGAKLHVLFMETLILLGGASMLWQCLALSPARSRPGTAIASARRCFAPQRATGGRCRFNAAAGVRQEYYGKFAAYLAERGFTVLTFDTAASGDPVPSD